MKRPIVAALLGVLVMAGAGWGVWAGTQSAYRVPPPAKAGPLGPAIQALGINEAVSSPLKMERLHGSPSVSRLAADAEAARSAGATWTRGHSYSWPRLSHDRWLAENRSWERMDTWVRVVQHAGLKPLAMISPWPGNHTRDATETFVLADPLAYARFVQAAVERYDGDGVADMPGLVAPIHHWEIDNEPDLKNLVDLRSQVSDGFASAEQFAEVLRVTAAAIRAADPMAVVVGGGFFKITREHGHAYMQALFSEPGVLQALDVISVHAYHQGPGLDELQETIQRVQAAAPGARIWVTETSVPSQGQRPWFSEEWQGQIAVATVLESLAWGVEKVFWHTLFDPPPAPGPKRRSGTASNSLYARTPSGTLREKPASVALGVLAQLLRGVDRSDVRVLACEGGRAWQVGQRVVLWGQGEVVLETTHIQGWALIGGGGVNVSRETPNRAVSVGAHGGLVVLGSALAGSAVQSPE
jgi:hypothetical protein